MKFRQFRRFNLVKKDEIAVTSHSKLPIPAFGMLTIDPPHPLLDARRRPLKGRARATMRHDHCMVVCHPFTYF